MVEQEVNDYSINSNSYPSKKLTLIFAGYYQRIVNTMFFVLLSSF